MNTFRGLILNALDAAARQKARDAWHERFNNRKPQPRDTAVNLAIRADGDSTDILLHDEIGYWGITSKMFAEKLQAVTTPKIVVRVNSPGGDVFDGLAIYEAIRADARQIDVKIEGIAASAASYIAMAGRTVSIAPSAMLMIHNAWGLAIGNKADFRKMADTLEKIDGQIAGIYARKSGKPADEFRTLMDAETWLDAGEAKALNMVDTVLDADPAADPPGPSDADRSRWQAMLRRLALEERAAA